MQHPEYGEPKRGKRSRSVGLSRMIASAGALAMVAACGGEDASPPPPEPKDAGPKTAVQAFGNVFECAKAEGMDEKSCDAARSEAIKVSDESAPRFAGEGDCEAEWGDGHCISRSINGSSFFMPMLAGFMLGKLINGKREYLPLYNRRGYDGYTTANGFRLGYAGAPGKYFAGARALERPRTIMAIKPSTGREASESRGGMSSSSSRSGIRVIRVGG